MSSWAEIKKGVPQGSILYPLLFNVFINDIFYFIKNRDLYNYADDNTLSFHSPNFDEIIKVLQEEGKMLIDWFCFNCMQANPKKFQAIGVGKRTHERSPTFKLGSVEITSVEEVKLLGVDMDNVINMYEQYQLHPHMVSERIFNFFFSKIYPFCALATNQIQ